jgi:hypothetical protein
LRCDFLPECYTASTAIRERRRTLRYRSLPSLLRMCRETVVCLGKTGSALVGSLAHHRLLVDRVERLITIPAMGRLWRHEKSYGNTVQVKTSLQ